ncbi:MAG TPA: virulence factor TspB C-terminal domain-related protein [Pseudomonadales bacterium]|nr:virulence factor TspB C-terminal domain-related protein [Pseudomonadales bacterium]
MRYDSSFNYAMAGLYRAAVAVSALIILLFSSVVYAADPPVPRSNVSVNVNPTTSYYTVTNSTLRLPNGVSTAPTGGLPVVTKYSGGLQQTIPTGITIDAIKKSAPLPVVVRSSTQSLKRAATGCLRSAKCNIPLILAGEGLNRLFDGLDWVMGEGGQITKISGEPNYRLDSIPDDYISQSGTYSSGAYLVHNAGFGDKRYCRERTNYVFLGYWPPYCYFGIEGSTPLYPPASTLPVSDDDIASGVDSNYTPEPSDWQALTPELELDDVEITSAPTLQGEPKTTTVYDAEGNPHKVTETNIWYDFDIRDNPSPRPALDMKTREETKTYEDGVLTSTTTTNSAASAGSNDAPPPPESLIDCDLFPTACAWFDWTQEEPVEPDTDLSGLLQEVPIVSETYTITGGVAACPAPMVLDLSVFGSREVSYQPLCDLASTMKYLYLALMSFAAAVLLNRSVNRV